MSDLSGRFQRIVVIISLEVISVFLPTDRQSGRPRGFGFVEMSDDDGKKAIAELDGFEMEGRNLRVNEARPREER